MTRIRWGTLPALLALTVVMTIATGIVAAQEEPQGLAPSGLEVWISIWPDGTVDDVIGLTWTPGNDDYRAQFIMIWETGDEDQSTAISASTPVDSGTSVVPFSFLDRGKSYTFQVVAYKGPPAPADWTERRFSNEASLYVPTVEEQEQWTQRLKAEKAQSGEEGAEELPATEEPRARTKPSGLTATQDEGAVTLNWTPGYNPNYVKQVVTRREAVKGTKLEAIHTFTRAAGEMEVSTYTDTTAETGKRYIYRIKALKANDKGKMSNAVKITVQ